jgi:hypothetical protein
LLMVSFVGAPGPLMMASRSVTGDDAVALEPEPRSCRLQASARDDQIGARFTVVAVTWTS